MIQRLLISIFASLAILGPLSYAAPVLAAPAANKDAVCEGVAATGGNCADNSGTVTKLVETLINILSWVVGVAAVVVIILGGLFYIISAGDPQKATKARQAILYAIIGLVIVALAQTIVRFTIGTLNR